MNAGAKKSTGKVLYFLHADTYPPSVFNNLIRDEWLAGKKAGSFRLRFDSSSRMLGVFAWFTRLPWYWVRFGDQSLYVDKAIFDHIGGFDERLDTMEDTDIVKRLRKHTKFAVIKDPVVTSARKYDMYGYHRVQLYYVAVVLLYHAGASQKKLRWLLSRIDTKPSHTV